MRLLSRDPSIDQLVPHGEGQRIIAVAVGSAVAIPGKSLPKMALEIAPQTGGRHFCFFVFGGSTAVDLKYRHFGPCIAEAAGLPPMLSAFFHRVVFVVTNSKPFLRHGT